MRTRKEGRRTVVSPGSDRCRARVSGGNVPVGRRSPRASLRATYDRGRNLSKETRLYLDTSREGVDQVAESLNGRPARERAD